jgi:hypothetical protein
VPLANSGLTYNDLGLTPITFSSSATTLSNAGIYFISPSASVVDTGYNTFFNYEFVNGLLTIEKLPLTIIPRDTTIIYGDKIEITDFIYQ